MADAASQPEVAPEGKQLVLESAPVDDFRFGKSIEWAGNLVLEYGLD